VKLPNYGVSCETKGGLTLLCVILTGCASNQNLELNPPPVDPKILPYEGDTGTLNRLYSEVQSTQDPDTLKEKLGALVLAQKSACEAKFNSSVSLSTNVKMALEYTGVAITAGIAIATGVGAIATAAGGITSGATALATLFTTTIPNTISVPSNAGVTQADSDMDKYVASNPNLNAGDFQVYRDYLAYYCFQDVTNATPSASNPSGNTPNNKAPGNSAPTAGSPGSKPSSGPSAPASKPPSAG
jgi:hypothetical protein